MNDLRESVGFLLKFPVIVIIGFFWTVYIWPFIVAAAVLCIVLKPPFYLIRYFIIWSWHAFIGSKDPVLPGYWQGYPMRYVNWLETGYPTLKRWLIKGWD